MYVRCGYAVFAVFLVWIVSMVPSHAQDEQPIKLQEGDILVEWENGYPAKKDGKLILKGKVTLKNGWESKDGKVTVKISPTKGGLQHSPEAKIDDKGNFEETISLKDFPVPGQEYNLVPMITVKKCGVKEDCLYAGKRETLDLQ